MSYKLLKQEVNEYLENYFSNKSNYNKLIYEAMGYSIGVGGKRIRPILMLLTYKMYKEDYKNVLSVAGAIEMIHTYSLIHDDLPCMDNDDLRRGMPTNHKKFTEGIAVLAGDGLLNEAFCVMLNANIEDNLKVKVMKIIGNAASVEGMIGGQIVDILSEGKSIEEEKLYYMHSKKTGELIKSSILAGAVLGEAEENEIEILRKYGEKLGLVFQIKDDILDVEGNKEKLGKNPKMDESRNKTNFITLYGIDKCKAMAEDMTKECFELLDSLKGNTQELKELTKFLLLRDF
ncbi:polyprenyl synthetase family protein [Hathewaya limosa]|uniref:Geranylgeranyl diphosphate synthase type II n=1 Tax=Hathewaya limosa TaxID=1536 RepID=A0ABU0JUJ3_HATLI|nr:farnesyl diphosphate synthase [Hathewaya limosa]MDQ0479798.1 geranylgeranyl diphosphate synthase type II [Hathewaya limosa]